MSEGEKPSRKFTVRYATDEDYKRMNFYTIGTMYRAEPIMAHRRSGVIDHTVGDAAGVSRALRCDLDVIDRARRCWDG